jgi:Rad3-related DNA helicase
MWNLYKDGNFLEPLKFSNGKNQGDVVGEVINAVKSGKKVIFIRGMCGTGKSAIALNIARILGKTVIVVPGKNLQSQYKRDYENDKFLLKEGSDKLKISIITGRNNHKCRFLEDNKNAIPSLKKEENMKLSDIFDGRKEKFDRNFGKDFSADNQNLPCKIEIKEKNWQRISEYLKQNKRVNAEDFTEIKDVKRFSIAPVCPYWSPAIMESYEPRFSGEVKKRRYPGIGGDFVIYQRKGGCGFYEQFNQYIDSDVIVFNSQKYKIEFAIGRKPKTEADIIDECDEFLDSFANQRTINLDRLQNTLIYLISRGQGSEKINKIAKAIKEIKENPLTGDLIASRKITVLKDTPVYNLLKAMLEENAGSELDEESYISEVEETARIFEDVFDETFVMPEKNKDSERGIMINLVTTNLAKKFQELKENNRVLILMSGTLHSAEVLRNIFGIEDFEVIEAETNQQGKIEVLRTGREKDCKYENFSKGIISRAEYLKSLDRCVEISKKPTLVHVNAYSDLPTDSEIEELGIANLISRTKLMEMQNEDKENRLIEEFKSGKTEVLFTTRCARGVDFPGNECNSIVFTKYPNSNPEEAFWKVLRQTKQNYYWSFYNDKAKRDLFQRVYRGLRFKNDHVFLLSPDERVLRMFAAI